MQELIKALITARQRSENAKKNASNSHFKNRYADLAAIIDVVNAACDGLGLAFVQDCVSDADSITVTTKVLHESGQIMDLAPLTMPIVQKTPQAVGSAMTYCRRYSLQTAFGIAAELDDDGNAASQRNTRPSAKPTEHDQEVVKLIKQSNSLDDLAKTWKGLTPEQRTIHADVKDYRKKELEA